VERQVKAAAGKRRGIVALLGVLSLWPVLALAQAAMGKIGYVDLKRLLDSAPQMAASRTKLEAEFAARDTALKNDEAKLATLRQRYDRDSLILSKDDADALKRQVDTLDRSIKRTREDLRTDLSTRATAERDRVWSEINNAVIEFAREQGYDLVLPSPVAYASGRIDITDQVLDRLRRQAQTKSKPP
jgi:outer membrane protein